MVSDGAVERLSGTLEGLCEHGTLAGQQVAVLAAVMICACEVCGCKAVYNGQLLYSYMGLLAFELPQGYESL
jgi:hypothetical protein